MANEATITVCGNATSEADLRFTQSGAAVANFTVACTPRIKDGESWTDGEPTFYRCAAWRQLGESVAETVTKGMRLVVHGRFKTRTFTDRDGNERLSCEIEVEYVGPDLRFATATVTKVGRDGPSRQDHRDDRRDDRRRDDRSRSRGGGSRRDEGYEDPWGSAPPASSGAYEDEPPF